MKKRAFLLLMTFILILILARGCVRASAGEPASPDAGAAEPTASVEDYQELERFLDALIAKRMERFHIPSEVIAVVRDGRVVLAKGYDYADLKKRTPVDPEHTLLRIGSVSKLFVWTAVMQLVEQGKLDLNADINTYLTGASGHR